MKALCRTILMLLIALTVSKSIGADFSSLDDSGIFIRGKIERGDYQRFRDFVLTGGNIWYTTVNLSSPGGDVVEALKFANLFDKSFIETRVIGPNKCDSACFIMWAGGVERSLVVLGQLGVHRISLREFQADIQKAKGLISPLTNDIGNYLHELGIPRALIDKMNETQASSIFRIDSIDIIDRGWYTPMTYQPVYLDMVEKSCGRDPDPFPGETIRDKPRDSQTMSRIKEWYQCMTTIRLKNRARFLQDDFQALERGNPTLLFTKDTPNEIRARFR